MVAGAATACVPALAENLLPNSGFLYCANPGIPSCWSAGGAQMTRADWPACWRPDDAAAVPGVKSMRLTNPKPRALVLDSAYVNDVARGKNYVWSVYLKTDTPGGVVRIQFLPGLGSDTKKTIVTSLRPTSEWKRFSATGVITDALKWRGRWYLRWEGQGTLWVCAPQFEMGTEPTDYAPARVDPTGALTGTAPPATSTECPGLPAAPRIDGKLDDPCWLRAARLGGFSRLGSREPASTATEVVVGRTADSLVFGIRCHEPNLAGLVAKARGGDDAAVFSDDEVEVFVSPRPDGGNYRHFTLSAAGGRHEEALRDADWNGAWQGVVAREAAAWTAELAIPFASLAFEPDLTGPWRLNVCRFRPQTPDEYSSWAPATDTFHDPRQFGILTGLDAATLRPWLVAVSGVSERRGVLLATLWSASRRDVKVEVLTDNGEVTKTLTARLTAGTTLVELGDRMMLTGPRVGVRLMDPAGTMLTSREFPLREMAPPLQAWLTRNAYADPAKVKVVACTAVLNSRVRVTPAGRATHTFEAEPDALGWAKISVPLTGRRPGTHPLEVRVLDRAGRSVAGTRLLATIQTPAANMVPWDPSTGCLIVDGHPYLPMSIGVGGAFSPRMVRDAASVGFNSLHVWFEVRKGATSLPAEPERVQAVLEECRRLGLRVIPGNALGERGFRTFAKWKDEALRALTQFRNDPGILAWDIVDEPSPKWEREPDWKESNMQELHDACKVIDPWRPAFINYFAWKPGYGFYGGLGSTDIYSMDRYNLGGYHGFAPTPYRTYEAAMRPQISQYRALSRDARRDGKPAHFWLHFYGYHDSYKEPSVQENIGQTWLALVHGFRMLSYFIYRPMSNDLWQSMEPLVEEVTTLTPVLGTPALPDVVESSSPAIHCAAFRYDGHWYVVTVNATDATVDARLTLSVPARGPAEVLFESRQLARQGAALTDRWRLAERHVYRIAME